MSKTKCLCAVAAIIIGLISMPVFSTAQQSQDRVVIDLDVYLHINPDGSAEGGGNLTYELYGKAAGDLRRAVLEKYDGLITGTPNGRIDLPELKMNEQVGYIANVESVLVNTAINTVSTNRYNPLHQHLGEDITADVQGFYEVTNIATDDTTPIRIYLTFGASSMNYSPSSEIPDSQFNTFKNALYYPNGINNSTHIHLGAYEFDYRYSFPELSDGSFEWPSGIMLLGIIITICVTIICVVYLITRRPQFPKQPQ